MMTRKEFLDKLTLAVNSKTLYVVGGFGAPANDKNKKRYANNHEYNKKIADAIMACSPDTFFFDCCGLAPKGILWGWNADVNATYGGAVYKSNDVPDIGTEALIAACRDVSTDFTRIEPGELLWQQGHVGIYVGDGIAIESTGLWKDGVQYVPLSKRTGKYEWKKHGFLPWVDYTEIVDTQKYQVGQLVYFDGFTYYGSAKSTSPWLTDPGVAIVTEYVAGAKHPYRIKGHSGTKVNGYVDEDDLSVYVPETYSEPTMTCSVSLPVLNRGTKSEAVKCLKLILNGRGAKLSVNDKYDQATEEAVKAFKSTSKIKESPDDLVARETWTKLIRG